jgi:DNA polymerase-4
LGPRNRKPVNLKIKLGDFRILTRARSLPAPPADAEDLFAIAADLLRAQLPLPVGARLLGLGLSNLINSEQEEPEDERQLQLAFG